jgi:hypothetical protein
MTIFPKSNIIENMIFMYSRTSLIRSLLDALILNTDYFFTIYRIIRSFKNKNQKDTKNTD